MIYKGKSQGFIFNKVFWASSNKCFINMIFAVNLKDAVIAQLAARLPAMQEIPGSSPSEVQNFLNLHTFFWCKKCSNVISFWI